MFQKKVNPFTLTVGSTLGGKYASLQLRVNKRMIKSYLYNILSFFLSAVLKMTESRLSHSSFGAFCSCFCRMAIQRSTSFNCMLYWIGSAFGLVMLKSDALTNQTLSRWYCTVDQMSFQWMVWASFVLEILWKLGSSCETAILSSFFNAELWPPFRLDWGNNKKNLFHTVRMWQDVDIAVGTPFQCFNQKCSQGLWLKLQPHRQIRCRINEHFLQWWSQQLVLHQSSLGFSHILQYTVLKGRNMSFYALTVRYSLLI